MIGLFSNLFARRRKTVAIGEAMHDIVHSSKIWYFLSRQNTIGRYFNVMDLIILLILNRLQ